MRFARVVEAALESEVRADGGCPVIARLTDSSRRSVLTLCRSLLRGAAQGLPGRLALSEIRWCAVLGRRRQPRLSRVRVRDGNSATSRRTRASRRRRYAEAVRPRPLAALGPLLHDVAERRPAISSTPARSKALRKRSREGVQQSLPPNSESRGSRSRRVPSLLRVGVGSPLESVKARVCRSTFP